MIDMINSNLKITLLLLGISFLSGCSVGPEYQKPTVIVANNYKEGDITWQQANPSSDIDRGQWWEIFNDPILNDLVGRLNKNNQDIKSASAAYKESLAIVDKTRAGFFPSISAGHASTSQKANYKSKTTEKDSSSHSLSLDASWEADVWGATRYSVKADMAAAKADKADLALKVLSAQSSLAQYYFELRGLDKIQEILDATVSANEKLLEYTRNNYKAGIMDRAALLNAENALYNSKSSAYNNKIDRAQYQHAISVLVGESASIFTLMPIKDYQNKNILVPVSIPSKLLERRPDIAKAEELVKRANAQIGVAQTAFFPNIDISSNLTMSGDGMGNLLSMPNFIWSVGPQMALGLFDAGARSAQSRSAKAAYEALVASYRQTVLSAFSEVEDQLSSLKHLNAQVEILNKSVDNNKRIFDISYKQYGSGIVDNAQLLNNQIAYYNARISAINIEILKRSIEIALVKALGGGWSNIPD